MLALSVWSERSFNRSERPPPRGAVALAHTSCLAFEGHIAEPGIAGKTYRLRAARAVVSTSNHARSRSSENSADRHQDVAVDVRSAVPRSSAICLSVCRERFCDRGAPLPSTGSARAAFPSVNSTIKALRLLLPNTASLIDSLRPNPASPLVRFLAAETSARAWPRVSARCHQLLGSVGARISQVPEESIPYLLPRSQSLAALTLTTSTVWSPLPQQ